MTNRQMWDVVVTNTSKCNSCGAETWCGILPSSCTSWRLGDRL